MNPFASLTRRRFLRQTVGFSAMAALRPYDAFAQNAGAVPPPDPKHAHMLMLGDWGTDTQLQQQKDTAAAMQKWVADQHFHPGALFMMGDNWYGRLDSVNDPRWQSQFETMYPASVFPGPAYAVLGNHDYERAGGDKVKIQLDYAAQKKGRWTMPSRWYTFQYPEKNPVAKFICLDSNLPGTKPWDPFPSSYVMSKEDRDAQEAWLEQELSKPRTAPFLIVVAHHPLFTNGIHRDNRILIPRWDPLLRSHKVDLYITGHDHDLQHLEFAGHPTSFVISGGGGAELVNWSVPPEKRGPFGQKVIGFSHLELAPDALLLRHLGAKANVLHAFRKTPDGKMTILTGA